ncbi:MAG: ribose 5-phosphate isomerase A [Candidatus Micrarchaeota archaeon]
MEINNKMKKINAAKKVFEFIEENSIIGLGSGTTTEEFIRLLSEAADVGFRIKACVPTSFGSRMCAIKYNLSDYLRDPDQINKIDVTIDGADSVGNDYVIKGGGAALTREKIIAYNSKKFIIIADDSKIMKSDCASVALECVKFSTPFVIKTLEKLGYSVIVRTGTGKIGPIISDNNNFIIDAKIEIKNAANLEAMLNNIPGVLENGIFTKFDRIIIGTEKGTYDVLPNKLSGTSTKRAPCCMISFFG